jgi:hypothetical protein
MLRHLLCERIARRLAEVLLHQIEIDHLSLMRIQSYLCLRQQEPPYACVNLTLWNLSRLCRL